MEKKPSKWASMKERQRKCGTIEEEEVDRKGEPRIKPLRFHDMIEGELFHVKF